jgi:inner membrane transporter RhtA
VTTSTLDHRPPGRPAVSSRRRFGAVGLVLAGALSVHSGAAVATSLFPRSGIGPMVSMRLVFGAVILLALCRPALRGRSRADWLLVLAFGAVLTGMNTIFYSAIDRIPLGLAVTLEVLGPLTLSVITAGRRSAWLWALLAAAGVGLLGLDGVGRLDPLGVALALATGVFWATYIVLSARVGRRFAGADGLALAMAVAGLLSLPFGLLGARPGGFGPAVLGLGVLVAVLSSALPYSLEMIALRTLPTDTFAVMMSLGPAIATAAGLLILGQALTPYEALAMVLIIAATIGAVRGSARPAGQDEAGRGGQRDVGDGEAGRGQVGADLG